jgi:hypothetical protein
MNMVFKKLACVGLAMSLAAAGALVTSVAMVSAASVVVVTHDGQHGWHSRITDFNGNPDPTYGSVTFVTGPNPMPPGNGLGSVRLMTNPNMRPPDLGCPTPPCSHGDGSAQFRNTNYGGVLLSAITQLNYYAYSAVNNGQQFPYMALNVSTTGGTTSDDILFFEPPYQTPATGSPDPKCKDQGPTVTHAWQQWDALNGCWWDNNGELGFPPCGFSPNPPCIPDPACSPDPYCPGGGNLRVGPLSDYIAKHPNARIVNPNGVGGLRLAVGFASSTDQFDGNVDMVAVGVNGSSTTYNFEPPPACKEADGNGDFHSKDGRHGDVKFDNDKCEESGAGGNGESDQGDSVDSNNRGDGQDFHSTNIESTQFDAIAGAVTITGVGTTNGVPVAFTLIAVGNSLTSLGSVTMVFSDGYSISGDLIDGSIALN